MLGQLPSWQLLSMLYVHAKCARPTRTRAHHARLGLCIDAPVAPPRAFLLQLLELLGVGARLVVVVGHRGRRGGRARRVNN